MRFVVLDGLRGIAALAVWTLHAPYFIEPIFSKAYLAVDFFFLLSGFVLARAYGGKINSGGMTVLDFMRLRLIRLYPLYLLAIAIALPFPILDLIKGRGDEGILTSLLPTLLFLPTLSHKLLFPLNVPAWSLFFELAANLLFIAVWRKQWTIYALIVVGWLSLATITLSGTDLSHGYNWATFGVGLSRVLFSFFLGTMLPILRVNNWIAPILLIGVLFYPASSEIYDLVCVTVVFPLVVMIGAGAVAGRLTGLYAILGALSYAIYVLQEPIYHAVFAVFNFHASPPAAWAWYFFGTIAFALLADRFYDGPIRRWLGELRGAQQSAKSTNKDRDRLTASATVGPVK